MLRAVQKGRFSYDFDVFDRTGARIATVDLANWHKNAKLEVQGRRYLARQETWAKEFVFSFLATATGWQWPRSSAPGKRPSRLSTGLCATS